MAYVLGLDMGGTNSVLGVVNKQGEVLARCSIKTAQYPLFDNYVEALYDAAVQLVEPLGGLQNIKGIGAGLPNGNHFTGNIEYAPNLPWQGIVPFASIVSSKFGLPIQVTNDANAAALGEMKFGAARGMKNFITITLGTGVGAGIVINGEVVYGCDGMAGELGHTKVHGELLRPCGCGLCGCLEAYASATGVVRTTQEFLQIRTEPSRLRTLSTDQLTSKEVYLAAMEGDAIAKDVFEFTGKLLGEKLSDFIAFSAPEAIILFGGLAQSGDLILEPTKRAMNKNVLRLWTNKVRLIPSGLPQADAAILGASALID